MFYINEPLSWSSQEVVLLRPSYFSSCASNALLSLSVSFFSSRSSLSWAFHSHSEKENSESLYSGLLLDSMTFHKGAIRRLGGRLPGLLHPSSLSQTPRPLPPPGRVSRGDRARLISPAAEVLTSVRGRRQAQWTSRARVADKRMTERVKSRADPQIKFGLPR